MKDDLKPGDFVQLGTILGDPQSIYLYAEPRLNAHDHQAPLVQEVGTFSRGCLGTVLEVTTVKDTDIVRVLAGTLMGGCRADLLAPAGE